MYIERASLVLVDSPSYFVYFWMLALLQFFVKLLLLHIPVVKVTFMILSISVARTEDIVTFTGKSQQSYFLVASPAQSFVFLNWPLTWIILRRHFNISSCYLSTHLTLSNLPNKILNTPVSKSQTFRGRGSSCLRVFEALGAHEVHSRRAVESFALDTEGVLLVASWFHHLNNWIIRIE